MATAARVHRKMRWTRLCAMTLGLAAGLGLIWFYVTPIAVSRGVAAYSRGDWGEALKLAEERLAAQKDDTKAWRLRARATARLGRFPAAQEFYSHLDAKDFEAEDYFLLGLGYSFRGAFPEALNVLNQALVADPDHADSLYLLAVVSYQKAQYYSAARAAGRLALRPGWEARGDLLLGMIHAAENDPAGAALKLRQALERDPDLRTLPTDQFSTQKLLARSLLRLGRSREARDMLQPIFEKRPDREASWLLSRAFLQEGNKAEAGSALAKSGTYRAEHALEPEPSPYIGETRCAACHNDIQRAVLASRHATTFARGEQLGGLHLPDHPLPDPDNPQVTHSLKRIDGRIQLETHVQNKVLRAVVDYAFGSSDRYTSFVGRDEQERTRTLRLSLYHGAEGSGWDRTKNQKAHPERADDFLGEPFASIQEADECLICHTTNPRAIRERSGPEFDDRAIGCEQCHGPGGLHNSAVALQFSDLAIANPTAASPADIVELCGLCHSQQFAVMPASRVAHEWVRFPGSTLPWSRCYAETGGALSCVTCHDPHRNAETSPTYYEQKCLSCHVTSSAVTKAPPARGHQGEEAFRSPCPVNPRRDCLGCHMPKVRHDWLHGSFTDHYIRVRNDATAGAQTTIKN
jgi:tetratricopeptide (TPR) repeat protein